MLELLVSTCVVEWIETGRSGHERAEKEVSTCVVEWIETSDGPRTLWSRMVSTCVVEWIETHFSASSSFPHRSPPAWWSGLKHIFWRSAPIKYMSPPARRNGMRQQNVSNTGLRIRVRADLQFTFQCCVVEFHSKLLWNMVRDIYQAFIFMRICAISPCGGMETKMTNYESGSYTVHDIKYYFVWATQKHYKVLKGEIAYRLRELLRQECVARKIEILEGSIYEDHVHMLLSCSTSMSPSQIEQYLKGRSSQSL